MAEVICVGVAFLDHIFEANPPTSPDSKTFATEYRQFGGGMAATASVAVALLGGRAVLWGRLGDDPAGRTILEGLTNRGVQTEIIRKIEGAQSPVSSVVIGEDGSRQAIVFPGRHLDNDPGWLPLGQIEETSAVLVDPRWPEASRWSARRKTTFPASLMPMSAPSPYRANWWSCPVTRSFLSPASRSSPAHRMSIAGYRRSGR